MSTPASRTALDVADWRRRVFALYAAVREADSPDDAHELDMEDAFAHDITLIEWAERIAPLLPADRLDIEIALDDADHGGRTVTLCGLGAWGPRLEEINL